MTSYEEEFLSTGQEARRLSIALLRFIQIDDPEWKNKYQEEILSFLMNLKKDRFGFHDREFTL